jgi:hypothetical protein
LLIAARFSRHKAAVLSICAVVAVGAVLFADWREWLPWPKLLHHSYTNFDGYKIYGKAPWCFLYSAAHEEAPDCHYLSEQHCQSVNYAFLQVHISPPDTRGPDTRPLCVPNPLK